MQSRGAPTARSPLRDLEVLPGNESLPSWLIEMCVSRSAETRQRLHTLDRQFGAQVQEMDRMKERLQQAEFDRLKLMERNHALEQRQRELLAHQQWLQHQESEGNRRRAKVRVHHKKRFVHRECIL